jgi:tRNA wybutosine-synthesizing protein 1
MIPKNVKEILKKQHYRIVGNHSAVQICRWTKNSLRNEGVCYKEKFYGIKSHQCCQMSPAVMWCPNSCVHCWRAIENTIGVDMNKVKLDSPSEIIEKCILAQRKLLEGFKINPETKHKTKSRANMKKYKEALEPTQFAISLSGEPMLYKHLGGIVEELRKREKTSFIVTNGLYPEKILELKNKKQLPTQLYVSVNAPNEKLFNKIARTSKKFKGNAWKKFNKSLEIMSSLESRTVFRMNLVRGLNMGEELIPEYIELIKKSQPMFIEVKGYMSVGFARQRLGYDQMPTFKEMKNFCEKLVSQLGGKWKLLDWHENSRAFVIGQDKNKLKIKGV